MALVTVREQAEPEWGEQDSNLRRQSQCVYSASPLTTRTSPRALSSLGKDRVTGGHRPSGFGLRGGQGPSVLNLEARVLGATQAYGVATLDQVRRNAPASPVTGDDEQVLAPFRAEALDQPLQLWLPLACIPPPPTDPFAGRSTSSPAPAAAAHPAPPTKVPVRAVAQRHTDLRPPAGEPFHRRQLAQIPLSSPRHVPKHTFGCDGTAAPLSARRRPSAAVPRAASRASSACCSRSGARARA